MAEGMYRWTKRRLRHQLAVIRGEASPSIVLKNATYLNSVRREWLQANIWIYQDRIIYVGEAMPTNMKNTEIVDCSKLFIVPGYIEHHAHPFQLYNPHTFAKYAAKRGTTTFINDNLQLFLYLDKKKALSLIEEMDKFPTSMYWWCRYDAQSELDAEEEIFTNSRLKEWLEHQLVVQGGELTSWPKVLAGDDVILHWMQETRRLGKPIEGHLPGASERTLTQMALLGVTSDHEAINGKEVISRLNLGYTTSLRYSSIRPDLPQILEEMLELGVKNFRHCLFTTDGGTPAFYEQGVIDKMIAIAIEKGVPIIDAYEMATYNVANYYKLDSKLGMIAPGRIAHLNFLESIENPVPVSVMAKGEWLLKNRFTCFDDWRFPWEDYGFERLNLEWDLTSDDLHFSMPVGIELVNSVILKPYQISVEDAEDTLSFDHDESFFAMIDKNGKWLINTMIKDFASGVSGLASSYSVNGDIVLIGKSKQDMKVAFRALKEQGGGVVIVENEEVISRIVLPLNGFISDKEMPELIEEEKVVAKSLRERGYKFDDPFYTLLFFGATHLPYVRVTERGIYDVHKKSILFPSIMR